MGKKMQSGTLEEHINSMVKSYNRWFHLYENGGSDPFHTDGINLNLVRNHINYDRKRIIDYCTSKELELPNEVYFPLPEEVPMKYMAKEDEILRKSKEAISIVTNNVDYQYLKEVAPLINDRELRNKVEVTMTRLNFNSDNLVSLRSRLYRFEENIEILSGLKSDVESSIMTLSDSESEDDIEMEI